LLGQGEVGEWNLLAGTFMAIAVLIDHGFNVQERFAEPALLQRGSNFACA
jgi:hypothetical protein